MPLIRLCFAIIGTNADFNLSQTSPNFDSEDEMILSAQSGISRIEDSVSDAWHQIKWKINDFDVLDALAKEFQLLKKGNWVVIGSDTFISYQVWFEVGYLFHAYQGTRDILMFRLPDSCFKPTSGHPTEDPNLSFTTPFHYGTSRKTLKTTSATTSPPEITTKTNNAVNGSGLSRYDKPNQRLSNFIYIICAIIGGIITVIFITYRLTRNTQFLLSDFPYFRKHCYSLKNKPRGICLIVNNVNFENGFPTRHGSTKDVTKLAAVFKKLHFTTTVVSDVSAAEMHKTFLITAFKVIEQCHDAFVCIILSHGGNNDCIYGVDGTTIKVNDILKYFNNETCAQLRDKPKMFFINACRGGK